MNSRAQREEVERMMRTHSRKKDSRPVEHEGYEAVPMIVVSCFCSGPGRQTEQVPSRCSWKTEHDAEMAARARCPKCGGRK